MSSTLPTFVSVTSPNPYFPDWWNNNFSASESTDEAGVKTVTIVNPTVPNTVCDPNYLIQVYTQPLVIKPWFIDYGNTKKADTTIGFHNVIDPLGVDAYLPAGDACPGNTSPGVYWTNCLINGKQHIAPQLKKTNTFHAWHPTTTFAYESPFVLTDPKSIAVVHLDSFYQKGDHFSQTFLTANSDCENFVVGQANSEMYREHMLLMQYEFSVDVSGISLPYNTFVMYNSYYGGNIKFLNSKLDDANCSLPMLNNNACDLNYGNIVNQITIDIEGNPTVTPTTMAFVDTKTTLKTNHYTFTNSNLYRVKPQLDEDGVPIYAPLTFNNPPDGPLDSDGNIVAASGFLVDFKTLPPLPEFPQPPNSLSDHSHNEKH